MTSARPCVWTLRRARSKYPAEASTQVGLVLTRRIMPGIHLLYGVGEGRYAPDR